MTQYDDTCECDEENGPCEDHCVEIFHVDDRRPPEDYPEDIISAFLSCTEEDNIDHWSGRNRVKIMQEDLIREQYAYRWAEQIGDQKYMDDYGQRMDEFSADLENVVSDFPNWFGGFVADIGGFIVWEITDGPLYEPTTNEPDEEDGFIADVPGGYGVSFGGKAFGIIESRDVAEQMLKDFAVESNFFPNCWFVDDHGGNTLISVVDGKYWTDVASQ